MKLGNYAHISVSVRSLDEAAAFYEKIGFRKLWGNNQPHPWALFTDGRVNLHLYEFFFSSPALHYFSSRMHDNVLELMRYGIKAEVQKSRDGNRRQHNIFDPNEISIMLMHHSDDDMPKPDGTSHSRLGTFGELSVNTDDLNVSIEFWQKLDFAPKHNSETPYAWTILSDGVMTVGLHQTTVFKSPALAYFAPNIADKIEELRSDGLSFTNITGSSPADIVGGILNAPDGQLFFLLKGSA